jgi:lysine 2,3-aminomutase
MTVSDWRYQLAHRLKAKEDIPPSLTLSRQEENFFRDRSDRKKLPFLVTPYYFGLADQANPACPIRRQFMPLDLEFSSKPYESTDPLRESRFAVLPGLVRRYRDRCVLKVTDMCAVHCRFCFRRFFTGTKGNTLTIRQVKQAALYVSRHKEIRELLLTGGDPLIFSDRRLKAILEIFRIINPLLVLRLGTRMPVVLPQRITPALVELLAAYRPLWISTHFNHSKELTEAASKALCLLIDGGIPVLNQTVLLKGINDKPEELEALFTSLVRLGVKPYYLFQGDLVKGTAHFRTSIDQGLKLMNQLAGRISGICLPRYAVDLPQGGGKVILQPALIKRIENGWYKIENYAKKLYKYPKEI